MNYTRSCATSRIVDGKVRRPFFGELFLIFSVSIKSLYLFPFVDQVFKLTFCVVFFGASKRGDLFSVGQASSGRWLLQNCRRQ